MRFNLKKQMQTRINPKTGEKIHSMTYVVFANVGKGAKRATLLLARLNTLAQDQTSEVEKQTS